MARRSSKKSETKSSSKTSSVYDSVTIPQSTIGDPLATASKIARLQARPSIIGGRYERRTAKRDARQNINQTNNVYDAFGNNVSQIGRRAQQALAPLPGRYARDVRGLAPLLAGSGPVGENAAASAMVGNTYAAGQGMLRGMQGRAAMYNQSVGQQGEIERKNFIQSFQEDLQNRLAEIANYMRQVRATQGATAAEMGVTLASEKFNQELQAAQLELQKAQALGQEGLAAALMEYINDLQNGNGAGGGSNRNFAGNTGGGYGAAGNPVGINAAEQFQGVVGLDQGITAGPASSMTTNNLTTMTDQQLGELLRSPHTTDFDKKQIIDIIQQRMMQPSGLSAYTDLFSNYGDLYR